MSKKKKENFSKYDSNLIKRFLFILNTQNEPLVIIPTIHLLTEYTIDYLIANNCKNYKKYFEYINIYTFGVKLDLVYELGLIEEFMYKNVILMNKIRNAYAHNLDADLFVCDLNFFDPKNMCGNLESFKRNETLPNMPLEERTKTVISWIGFYTFGYIHNHILEKHLQLKME